jgi:uncharacterized protein (DUF1330 family)
MKSVDLTSALLLLLCLSLGGCSLGQPRSQDAQATSLRPSAEQVRLLRQHPGFATQPFVMMNLLKFRGEAARDLYFREYAAPALELIGAGGGELVWAGAVEQAFVSGGTEQWDYLVLVRWPSRKAFLDMLESPAYARLTEPRERGLAETTVLVVAEARPVPPIKEN